MNSRTEYLLMPGPAGQIEVAIDRPALDAVQRGTAVIAHPHPLFGGTMHNKVAGTLARAFVQAGWTAVRFNFRGVGNSEGVPRSRPAGPASRRPARSRWRASPSAAS